MKTSSMEIAAISAALAIISALSACGDPQPGSQSATESVLVCEGTSSGSGLLGLGPAEADSMNVTITRNDGVIVKAVSPSGEFTTTKVDMSTKENKGPIYVQLIVEKDRIILRKEVTEDSMVYNTIIDSTGAYEHGSARGQCVARQKVF